VQACVQEHEFAEPISFKKEVEVVSGAVHFRDIQSFSSTMAFLHQGGVTQLQEFEQSIGFQNSLRRKLIEIKEAELDAKIVTDNVNVLDQYLSTVLNEKGIYFIGSTIHKIGSEFEYSLENGNEVLLETAIKDNDIGGNSGRFFAHQITGLGMASKWTVFRLYGI
jgi:hypothetical protein